MEINDEEHQKWIMEAVKISSFVRGMVLNELAFLEIMIDSFLANHFCKGYAEKRDFLKILMQSKFIIFENKRIIFNEIIKNHYPDFKKSVPNYHKLMGDIRDMRNKLAHQQLDISIPGIEAFIKSKNIILLNNVKESEELKEKEIEIVVSNTKWIANQIATLSNSIGKASRPSVL